MLITSLESSFWAFPRPLIDTFDRITLPLDNVKICMWKPSGDNRPIRSSAKVHALAAFAAKQDDCADVVETALVHAYWRDKDLFHRHWEQYMEDAPKEKESD